MLIISIVAFEGVAASDVVDGYLSVAVGDVVPDAIVVAGADVGGGIVGNVVAGRPMIF